MRTLHFQNRAVLLKPTLYKRSWSSLSQPCCSTAPNSKAEDLVACYGKWWLSALNKDQGVMLLIIKVERIWCRPSTTLLWVPINHILIKWVAFSNKENDAKTFLQRYEDNMYHQWLPPGSFLKIPLYSSTNFTKLMRYFCLQKVCLCEPGLWS